MRRHARALYRLLSLLLLLLHLHLHLPLLHFLQHLLWSLYLWLIRIGLLLLLRGFRRGLLVATIIHDIVVIVRHGRINDLRRRWLLRRRQNGVGLSYAWLWWWRRWLTGRPAFDLRYQDHSREGAVVARCTEQDVVESRSVQQVRENVTGWSGSEVRHHAFGRGGDIDLGSCGLTHGAQNIGQGGIGRDNGQLIVLERDLRRHCRNGV